MELRHLRYFVAVAEAGSLKIAATQRLHTTQPSLSRQIRDMEEEIGAKLLARTSRGITLTPAGRVFLDHARVVLSQVEIGIESARRLADTAKPYFVLGFLTGHETTWLPEALQLLRDELPGTHVVVSSQVSPQLAVALSQGRVDAAFLRREDAVSDLEFRLLTMEPLEVFMRTDHRLAALKKIDPQKLAGEPFLSISGKALTTKGTQPALRIAIDAYLKKCDLNIRPSYEVDNLAGAMSLITSTNSVALLPVYAKHLLLGPVTSRPLKGKAPTIDLCLGFKRDNDSPILRHLVSRVDELIARVSSKLS
jgi:LysR family transcriptional regulator, hca operon transcriptional activator